MAKVKYLGDDRVRTEDKIVSVNGQKFTRGEPVEVTSEETLALIKDNPYYEIEKSVKKQSDVKDKAGKDDHATKSRA